MFIETEEDLRAIYGHPKETVVKKMLNKLDHHCRHFISLSPFLVMATSRIDGHADASPKGDRPGFVEVQDDRTLLIPDRIGNNIADSLSNIIQNPEIGLIFFIPGIRETLRVNGTCQISADEKLLDFFSEQGKPPRSVISVEVREAYMHCGKSIIRSELWTDTNKISQKDFPTLGKILADQISELDAESTDKGLENSYKNRLY